MHHPQKICWSPHPQNLWIWLYLKIVFSDGIKLGWTPTWLMWTLISYDWCPYKKRKDAETHRENHVMMGARMEWPICKPRNAKDCQWHQKPRERPGTLLLQDLQREHGPAATLISISHFQNSSFLCCDFKPPSLWNLVIAALENQCSFSLLLLENIVVVPVVNLRQSTLLMRPNTTPWAWNHSCFEGKLAFREFQVCLATHFIFRVVI